MEQIPSPPGPGVPAAIVSERFDAPAPITEVPAVVPEQPDAPAPPPGASPGVAGEQSDASTPTADAQPAEAQPAEAPAVTVRERVDAPPSVPAPVPASAPPPVSPSVSPSADSDFSRLFTDVRRPAPAEERKATRGLRGFLARAGLRVAPSAAERAETERRVRVRQSEIVIRQVTWSRAVSVLVANPKGGTGKTPTALAIGGTIASIRGGQTAIVEVSDDPGALNYRAEGSPLVGLGELVRDLGQVTSAGRLAGYTAPQSSFAAVIGSVGRRPRLTGDAVEAVCRLIDEFYSVRIMDSGNQPTSEAFRAAVTMADALVIPVLNAGDSTVEALRLLEELRADGGHASELADRAIAIRLIDGRLEDPVIAAEVEQVLGRAGIRSIFTVPYDSHLAERAQITLGRLEPATREVFAAAAAAVVRELQRSVAVPAPDA